MREVQRRPVLVAFIGTCALWLFLVLLALLIPAFPKKDYKTIQIRLDSPSHTTRQASSAAAVQESTPAAAQNDSPESPSAPAVPESPEAPVAAPVLAELAPAFEAPAAPVAPVSAEAAPVPPSEPVPSQPAPPAPSAPGSRIVQEALSGPEPAQNTASAPAPAPSTKTQPPQPEPVPAAKPKPEPQSAPKPQSADVVPQSQPEPPAPRKPKKSAADIFAAMESMDANTSKNEPVKTSAVAKVDALQGSAAQSAPAGGATTASSKNARAGTNDVSSTTSSALKNIARTQVYKSVTKGASSEIKAETSQAQNGSVSMQMSDGSQRTLLEPDKPTITLSEAAASLIDADKSGRISFIVRADGTVSLNDVFVTPSAIFPDRVRSEIAAQVSRWRFSPADSTSNASFEYTIKKAD